MIKTLRKRFIRIAMLAVTAVLLALCLIVNAANYISVDNSLTNMLQIISNNRGMVPQSPPGGFDKPGTRPEGGFTPETPFSTRYFVLWYDADGTLLRFDLGKIAAVTEADIAEYLQAAAKQAPVIVGSMAIVALSHKAKTAVLWPFSWMHIVIYKQ